MRVDLEDRLREAFANRAAGVQQSPDAWSRLERRVNRRRASTRILVIAVALTVSGLGSVSLWLLFGATRTDEPPAPVPLAPSDSIRVTTIAVGDVPQAIAVGDDAVWVSVTDRDGTASRVVRIDPATNEVSAEVSVRSPVSDLVAGGGAVWGVRHEPLDADASSYQGFLVQIDATSNEVESELPGINGPLAFGAGTLWAVDTQGSLVRIDPSTGQVVATIFLEARPWFVSVSDGAAWILPLAEGEGRSNGLFRIDPATNSVTDFVEIPGAPSIFAPVVGRESVWVPIVESNGDALIIRIDSQTNMVLGSGMPVPSSLAVGIWRDDILLLGERGVLYDFSTESSETQEVVSGLAWPANDSVAPSAELDLSDSVWVANFENTVTRVNLAQE